MAEVVVNPDPLVVRAFRTRDLLTSARAVIAALHLDDSAVDSIRDPFILVVDEEGIWLCPEDPDRPPHIRIQWSMVGRLRDSWDSTFTVGEVAGAVVGLIVPVVVGGRGVRGATLRVPVLAKSGTVELKIATDALDGIARDAERRRPRPTSGPMLQWVPD